ncbi:phosphodiesterase [Dendrosporobacter sp. 1207_IL3150]|uniref:phosphodiesterase n=1 Tax=Dendrosporobacter sp. 1207_IL3150 TaxID=3084054 RepID=UPI002FDB553A
MKIGIISDTHGCAETWVKVFDKFFYDADFIIHAGDVLYHGPRNDIPAEYNPKQLAELINSSTIPIIVSCGNCDAEVDSMVLDIPIQSPYCHIMANNFRIIATHGHKLSIDEQQMIASKYKASLFITGHTHIANLAKINGIIFLNPGSPSMSKRADGRGTIAILDDGSVSLIDIENGEVLQTELL